MSWVSIVWFIIFIILNLIGVFCFVEKCNERSEKIAEWIVNNIINK